MSQRPIADGEVDTTPRIPCPPAPIVDAAIADLLLVMADATPSHGGEISLPADHLVGRLQKKGHPQAIAHWALHLCVQREMLSLARIPFTLPFIMPDPNPGFSIQSRLRKGGPSILEKFGGQECSIGIPAGPHTPLNTFRVVATPKLWGAWQHSDQTRQADTIPEPVVPAMPPGDVAQKTWQEVAAILEKLCATGEQFTSRAKLAQRIVCSVSTVQKAIASSDCLLAWAAAKPLKTPPKINAIDPNHVQTASSPPSLMPSPEEMDKLLKKLIDEAPPERRLELAETLAMMSLEERQQLAGVYEDSDDLDAGSRPRKL